MPSAAIQPAPDWFDRLWDSNRDKLPILLRTDAAKKAARGLVGVIVESLGAQAKTPEGVRQLIAFGRIYTAARGVKGVFDTPDPSPEQVADFVERIVEKVKP